MKVSRIVGIVAGIFLVLFLLNCLMIFSFGFSRRPEMECPFPDSGTWICEQLGITFFLDKGTSVIEIDDDVIKCYMLREHGSYEVYVCCYEMEHPVYDFAYTFFSGTFQSIEDDVFYVEEHKTGTVYSFSRIAE